MARVEARDHRGRVANKLIEQEANFSSYAASSAARGIGTSHSPLERTERLYESLVELLVGVGRFAFNLGAASSHSRPAAQQSGRWSNSMF
jgi:hypothetical protein